MEEMYMLFAKPGITADDRVSCFYQQHANKAIDPDRGRVSDEHLMAHLRDQVHKPVTVARRFHTDQRRCRQLTVETLGFSVGMHQLPFSCFSGLGIDPRDLLPTGMVITPYNHH